MKSNFTVIKTANAPAAIGSYSQAIINENLVYTSGQIALNEHGNIVGNENIRLQTEQVMRNLAAILEASGSGLNYVIKTTCFLANMEDFTAFNQEYSKFFQNSFPARSCVEVARLPRDVLIEVEAIARIKSPANN